MNNIVFQWVLTCICLNMSEVKYIFICSSLIFLSSCKLPLRVCYSFFHRIISIFSSGIIGFLCIRDISPFSVIYTANTFSSSVICIFTLLMVFCFIAIYSKFINPLSHLDFFCHSLKHFSSVQCYGGTQWYFPHIAVKFYFYIYFSDQFRVSSCIWHDEMIFFFHLKNVVPTLFFQDHLFPNKPRYHLFKIVY